MLSLLIPGYICMPESLKDTYFWVYATTPARGCVWQARQLPIVGMRVHSELQAALSCVRLLPTCSAVQQRLHFQCREHNCHHGDGGRAIPDDFSWQEYTHCQ